MRDLADLVALLEMRQEQLRLHLRFVRAGSVEARRIQSLIATMRMRKRLLEEFTADESRARTGMTVH
jgi:hypothetical protein